MKPNVPSTILLVSSVLLVLSFAYPESDRWEPTFLAERNVAADPWIEEREPSVIGEIEYMDFANHYARMAAPPPPLNSQKKAAPAKPATGSAKPAKLAKPNKPKEPSKPVITTNTNSATTKTTEDRTTCNPDECPKFCEADSSKTAKHPRDLFKRFFEIPTDNPGLFVNRLLGQTYCENLSNPPNKYRWTKFDTKRREYAAAIKGLCGCTAIFAASEKGGFSSHIWEENKNDNKDLQPKNYKKTMEDLAKALSLNKDDLKGGEVHVILPKNPKNTGQPLYEQAIVDAIKKTVEDSTGLGAQLKWYIPEDWKKSAVLGTNELGTACIQFDPKYTPKGASKPVKAYRIWSENKQLAEHTWSQNDSGSSGPSGVRPVIPPSQPTCNPKPSQHYQDAHSNMVHLAARVFCKNKANNVMHNKVRIGFEEVPGPVLGNDRADDNYDFKVASVDGCPAPGGYNLAEPVKGTSCETVMDTAWEHCNNAGRGGTITAGCLTYGIHPRY